MTKALSARTSDLLMRATREALLYLNAPSDSPRHWPVARANLFKLLDRAYKQAKQERRYNMSEQKKMELRLGSCPVGSCIDEEKITAPLRARVAELEADRDQYLKSSVEYGNESERYRARAIVAEARVAELEEERALIWDALLPFECTGCGSTKTIEKIRTENPLAISCCPERDMQPRAARLEALLKAEGWSDEDIRIGRRG